MKEKTETFNQGKRYFFYILMFAILGWFIFMQIFGADERSSDASAASVIYSGTVTWQKPDGTTQEISVPGTYKVPVGDTMVLTIQLPDDLTDTCFAIRSSLQDVDFYVGDNLRASYSTHKTRLVGKNSASRYVFCPVYVSDAGKELRIELTTYTSNYTGVVNPVYCGDKADIWIYIFSRYGLETYIAFLSCLPESSRSCSVSLWDWSIIHDLTWNILDGAWLWAQSGCWVNPSSVSSWSPTLPLSDLCASL